MNLYNEKNKYIINLNFKVKVFKAKFENQELLKLQVNLKNQKLELK